MNPATFFARYDAFGERRTGGDGDAASAAWLMEQAAAGGAAARLMPISFTRFAPTRATLEGPGFAFEGLPLFDGGLTDAEGISGALGPLNSDAPVAWAEVEPNAASLPGNAFAQLRARTRHAGIVIAPRTRSGGLAPINAQDAEAPFGPPVLQLAGRESSRLAALAANGTAARLIVQGGRGPGLSHNVAATLSGSAPPLVLLTPRTSWWTCTAERGGGILAWLTALDALAGARRSRAAIAVATCGHELGHIGAHRFFAAHPTLAAEAMLVVHLGANLGTAEEPHLTVRSNVPGLADRMAAGLADAGYPRASIEAMSGGKAGGEAHEIESRGGRYLSLIGRNPRFHSPEDRWPAAVDAERAGAIARSVAALAVELAV
jgi:hypothetical protein